MRALASPFGRGTQMAHRDAKVQNCNTTLPAPVCTEEPIGTIVRNRERTDIDWPHHAAKLFERGQDLPIDLPDVGKVVLDQPETCGRRIIGDDHEAMPGHPCELCK